MSMHADECRGEEVVPMKRSNNESIFSAEIVEGRTSPKGNGGETAAVRTLGRKAASNGLIAVPQAVRQECTVHDGEARSRPAAGDRTLQGSVLVALQAQGGTG
jgi:hypothetical protein